MAPVLSAELGRRLGEEFVDGGAGGEDGVGASGEVFVLGGDVDFQVAIHRGEDVLRRFWIFGGFAADGVGGSHDAAALDAAAGDGGAV